MKSNDTAWVDELFLILDIPASKQEWQQKFDDTLYSLKNEVQFMISTLNNNEQQLIQEAQKRVTSYYINGSRSNLTNELKVVASEILLRNQQPEIALTVLQPIDMQADAKYFINFGRALMQIGILDQARHCFITASEKAPDSPEPLFHLGFYASISGDVRAAESFYRESLDHDENYVGSLLNLSYLHYQMENFDAAIGYAGKTMAVAPDNVGGYLTMISCLNAQSKFDESAKVIVKAREKFADSVVDLDELEAVVCFEMKDYPRTIELVSRYIEARPAAVDMRYIRARSNIRLENWVQALVDIEEFLSLEPYDSEMLEMRFIVLFSAERWQEAEIAYIKLLENAPQLRAKYQSEYAELRKNLAIVIG